MGMEIVGGMDVIMLVQGLVVVVQEKWDLMLTQTLNWERQTVYLLFSQEMGVTVWDLLSELVPHNIMVEVEVVHKGRRQ
jgi:hypothetical protein